MTRFDVGGVLADALDCLSPEVRNDPDGMPDDSCASPPTDTAMMVDESLMFEDAVGLTNFSTSTYRQVFRVCARGTHGVTSQRK